MNMEVKFAPGFWKSVDKLFHWKYAPLRWYKKVKNIPREIKWVYQRATRGWADCDAWGMDTYLAKVMSGMFMKLSKDSYGYPSRCKTPEEWENLLRKWATVCEVYSNKYSDFRTEDLVQKQMMETLKEISEWYPALWD